MLNTTLVKEGEINIVYLMGHLDATTADQLEKLLVDFAADGSYKVILEMSELSYISSNGLRPLIAWLEATRDASAKRRLVVCNLQEFVQSVFKATGFDRKFPAYDSVESAVDAF